MDQTRCCGWVVFVLMSKFFSGLLLVKRLNSKLKLLLGFFPVIKEKSRLLHILVTAPSQLAQSFFKRQDVAFSQCEVLTCYPWAWNFPIKIMCDSCNSMAFLLYTYLWHLSDASNLPEVSFTMVPFQKKQKADSQTLKSTVNSRP